MAVPEPAPGDSSLVVQDSHAAVMASAERITVVGRWVVLAAAVILNHFGNSPAAMARQPISRCSSTC